MYQKSLGVTITLDPVEGETLIAMRKEIKTRPQMNSSGWCADYPDPQDWLSILASNTSSAQNAGYKNPEADKLIAAADVEVDPTKRMQLYDQAQKLIIGDSVLVILGNSKTTFLVKPYVKGLDFTPQDSDYPGQMTSLLKVTLQK